MKRLLTVLLVAGALIAGPALVVPTSLATVQAGSCHGHDGKPPKKDKAHKPKPPKPKPPKPPRPKPNPQPQPPSQSSPSQPRQGDHGAEDCDEYVLTDLRTGKPFLFEGAPLTFVNERDCVRSAVSLNRKFSPDGSGRGWWPFQCRCNFGPRAGGE